MEFATCSYTILMLGTVITRRHFLARHLGNFAKQTVTGLPGAWATADWGRLDARQMRET